MNRDFTLEKYVDLIKELKNAGYSFYTFTDYIQRMQSLAKFIVLRHDVDLLPFNSLRMAEVEKKIGVVSTYYFRAVPESWEESVIKKIASMGHEVGYHYESLTTTDGDVDKAYEDFKANLEKLRALVPVSSICMHGSPRSPYDSKDIWKKFDYKSVGIVGEPYLDVDFGQMFYLTDTGRRWDGYKVSVRDKIPQYQNIWEREGLVFRHTKNIIERATSLPEKIMITTHPQRWEDSLLPWVKELLLQNVKNVVKKVKIILK